MKISVVDYGINNIFSISGAIKKIGFEPNIVKHPSDLCKSEKIILPGVGAFSAGMDALNKSDFSSAISQEVKKGTPILGICLGLQMLFSDSNEYGHHKGLNLISGKVELLDRCKGYLGQKIPNIGWRNLSITSSKGLYKNFNSDSYFYFIHSYFINPSEKEIVTSQCLYEGMKINASIQKDNIFGVQYHPEKSGTMGLEVLKSFLMYE